MTIDESEIRRLAHGAFGRIWGDCREPYCDEPHHSCVCDVLSDAIRTALAAERAQHARDVAELRDSYRKENEEKQRLRSFIEKNAVGATAVQRDAACDACGALPAYPVPTGQGWNQLLCKDHRAKRLEARAQALNDSRPPSGINQGSGAGEAVPHGHCNRCPRCGWAMAEPGGGMACRPSNCSMRPMPPLREMCAGCGAPYNPASQPTPPAAPAEPPPPPACMAPTWCNTVALKVGPGLDSKLGRDYVRGWNCELFCSIACRDREHPQMRGMDADGTMPVLRPCLRCGARWVIFAGGTYAGLAHNSGCPDEPAPASPTGETRDEHAVSDHWSLQIACPHCRAPVGKTCTKEGIVCAVRLKAADASLPLDGPAPPPPASAPGGAPGVETACWHCGGTKRCNCTDNDRFPACCRCTTPAPSAETPTGGR